MKTPEARHPLPWERENFRGGGAFRPEVFSFSLGEKEKLHFLCGSLLVLRLGRRLRFGLQFDHRKPGSPQQSVEGGKVG